MSSSGCEGENPDLPWMLLEEFKRVGCTVTFVHRPLSDDPTDQLLLRIQGAVTEYERAVLGERSRRGRCRSVTISRGSRISDAWASWLPGPSGCSPAGRRCS